MVLMLMARLQAYSIPSVVSTTETDYEEMFIPIHLLIQLTASGSNDVKAHYTVPLQTTFQINSLFGTVGGSNGEFVFNVANSYNSDASPTIEDTTSNIVDPNDVGMIKYDSDAQNILDKFAGTSTVLDNNDIPAAYKYAITQREILPADYLEVGSGIWDITGNTRSELKLGNHTSDEYGVGTNDFSVRGCRYCCCF